ncbi:unnamed protein product [Ranitomeya imitator]|uniref:Uncharacterized protein n=1 Tax=Ranitomeya imitator TaxID=111125 RepID=A0ABN9MBK6_9NEOB|nr:unnamed protein product [Ranitomeya imitator]
MWSEARKHLGAFRKKYGSIYTLYFGHCPVVVLCGYDTVKEALIDQAEEFGGRGRLPTIDQVVKGYGLIFSNGNRWKDLRRFSLAVLRNFGMGKKSVEERIQEEISFLIAEIKLQKEQYIDPTSLLVQAIANIICSITFGNRFEYSDNSFQKLLSMFSDVFQDMSSIYGQFLDMLPTLMGYIPGPHQRIKKSLTRVTDFILERIKMNEESFDPNSPRDFIDCFLTKQKQEKDNPNFDRNNMVMTILNLFFAGSETTSSTLRHGLMAIMKYPEIQVTISSPISVRSTLVERSILAQLHYAYLLGAAVAYFQRRPQWDVPIVTPTGWRFLCVPRYGAHSFSTTTLRISIWRRCSVLSVMPTIWRLCVPALERTTPAHVRK